MKSVRMKYTVIIEKGESSYGVFAPDIPGCIAVGASRKEALAHIKDAIALHVEGLKEENQPIPIPHCDSAHVVVSVS